MRNVGKIKFIYVSHIFFSDRLLLHRARVGLDHDLQEELLI